MKTSLALCLALTVLVVGCKPKDSTDTTSTDTTKTTSTTKTDATSADASATTGTAGSSASTSDSGNSLVGTWTSDDKDLTGMTVEFKADGTASMSGTSSTPPKGAKVEATESYKLEGTKLTVHPLSLKATAPDSADAATKKQVDDINKSSEAFIKAAKDDVDTIEWKDKDTFIDKSSSSGKTTTFTRKS